MHIAKVPGLENMFMSVCVCVCWWTLLDSKQNLFRTSCRTFVGTMRPTRAGIKLKQKARERECWERQMKERCKERKETKRAL